MPRPHIVRVRQAKILVEPVAGGQEFRQVSEMPFAEDRRGVAALLHDLGKGQLVAMDAVGGFRAERALDADAIGITTGQQPRARRRADG